MVLWWKILVSETFALWWLTQPSKKFWALIFFIQFQLNCSLFFFLHSFFQSAVRGIHRDLQINSCCSQRGIYSVHVRENDAYLLSSDLHTIFGCKVVIDTLYIWFSHGWTWNQEDVYLVGFFISLISLLCLFVADPKSNWPSKRTLVLCDYKDVPHHRVACLNPESSLLKLVLNLQPIELRRNNKI